VAQARVPENGVAPHDPPFVLIKETSLEQDIPWDPELAQIMQTRCFPPALSLFSVKSTQPAQSTDQIADLEVIGADLMEVLSEQSNGLGHSKARNIKFSDGCVWHTARPNYLNSSSKVDQ
jgi:hypothetical protein